MSEQTPAQEQLPLCACGCGLPTAIATRTDERRGHVKGQPTAFRKGHNGKERQPPTECAVEGCTKKQRSGGGRYCAMHASRLLRTGSFDNPRLTSIDRFFALAQQVGDCWVWMGRRHQSGYGYFRTADANRRAHRVAYEFLIGPIPTGLVLDHLCRNRACVNPYHLDPVPNRVNLLRGIAARRSSS